jgi:hypothetical protein
MTHKGRSYYGYTPPPRDISYTKTRQRQDKSKYNIYCIKGLNRWRKV